MASIYERDESPYLWVSFKNASGTWTKKRTPFTHDQRSEAEAMARSLERRAAAHAGSALTVSLWAATWFEHRRKTILSFKDDESRITLHILSQIGSVPLADVQQTDIQKIFDGLKTKLTSRGKLLSGATIRCIYAATMVMFQDALTQGHIDKSPVLLMSGTLPPTNKKATVPYTLKEVEQLLLSANVPEDRRVCYALLFFLGLRFGEAAALRWSDWDQDCSPLTGIHINKSYSISRKATGATKTGTQRKAPVHPALAAMLSAWRGDAKPTDLMVPSRTGRERSGNHMLKKLHQDLERLGLPRRKLHAFRTSYISLLRSADVDKDKVRAITHGRQAGSDVIDRFYTVWGWKTLCDVVTAIPFHTPSTVPATVPKPSTVSDAQLLAFARGGVCSAVSFVSFADVAQNEGFESRPPRHFSSIKSTSYDDCGKTVESLLPFPEPIDIADLMPAPVTDENLYPRVAVTCTKCERASEVQSGPGSSECPLCDGRAIPC